MKPRKPAPARDRDERDAKAKTPQEKSSMSEFSKSMLGVLVGGMIAAASSAGVAWLGYELTAKNNQLAAELAARNSQRQFQLERSRAFIEFFSGSGLPSDGTVPADCQKTLEFCRKRRQSALETYLFIPDDINLDLIRMTGPGALAQTLPPKDQVLTEEEQAFDRAMKATKKWLTGEEAGTALTFQLPCADWKKELAACSPPVSVVHP